MCAKDERWRTFLETVPIALNTDIKGWISDSQPQPKTCQRPDRRLVELHAPRPHEAVWSSPFIHWACGFGRNAFGHAVMKKYGIEASHSHSGIDRSGCRYRSSGRLLLWLGFLESFARSGGVAFRANPHDYPGAGAAICSNPVTAYAWCWTALFVTTCCRCSCFSLHFWPCSLPVDSVVRSGKLPRRRPPRVFSNP